MKRKSTRRAVKGKSPGKKREKLFECAQIGLENQNSLGVQSSKGCKGQKEGLLLGVLAAKEKSGKYVHITEEGRKHSTKTW